MQEGSVAPVGAFVGGTGVGGTGVGLVFVRLGVGGMGVGSGVGFSVGLGVGSGEGSGVGTGVGGTVVCLAHVSASLSHLHSGRRLHALRLGHAQSSAHVGSLGGAGICGTGVGVNDVSSAALRPLASTLELCSTMKIITHSIAKESERDLSESAKGYTGHNTNNYARGEQ